ncbi:hypothetical protein [Bartonella sp. LJL80]
MNLVVGFHFKNSTSMLAIAATIGGLLANVALVQSSHAETLYDGTNTNLLQYDPTGSSNNYKRFISTISQSNIAITIDGTTADGKNGQWNTTGSINAPYVVYGGIAIQSYTLNGNGADGDNISNNKVIIRNVAYSWSGQNAPNAINRGRLGGVGGGTAIGGVSVGSEGPDDSSSGAGNGGNGGDVFNNKVSLSDTALVGANGGSGGTGGELSAGHTIGGGGLGGLGGATILGGLSLGGANKTNSGNGNGGDGGNVYDNVISLKNVSLRGGEGGNGGSSGDSQSGGGVGGMGGGSVFGGASIGGAGGIMDGGYGQAVYNNTITLTNSILQGGIGGKGGTSSFDGGSGAGGMGGGSVVGGLSIAGAGGLGAYGSRNGGDVYQNTIILKDVTLIGANGGLGGDVGTYAGKGADGLLGGSVYGGVSVGGASGDGDGRGSVGGSGGKVSNNKIKISGASFFSGNVYGGYSLGSSVGDGGQQGVGGIVTGNTITLEGDQIKIGTRDSSNNMTSFGAVYGGYSVNGDGSLSSADVFTGNTLNLLGYRGTVSGIYNFETYNWTLPSDVKNGDVLVTIANSGAAVDLTNTKHTVADMATDGNRLNTGDTVTMINKTQGNLASQSYTIKQGNFVIYGATLAQQNSGDRALTLTVDSKNGSTVGNGVNGKGSAAKLNPQSKSYSEGRAAALGFVNQGSDLISSQLGDIRLQVSSQGTGNSPALIPFMIANGSSQRYKTGSHVDIDGFNMAVGLATGFDFAAGHKATVGAFFEYGRGTYDTYNSFTNFASVHGDGDSNYKGGGIFGRIDFAGTGLGRVRQLAADQADGLYVEASLRAGRAKSEFDVGRNADVLGNFTGAYRGSYDSSVTYYGGHVAGGYVFNFDERQALDVYGRYLWTHMDGDDVSVANEPLHFDSSLSSRIQLGGRYAYAYSEQFKPYIGAVYEYEFDGEVKAKAYEFNLDRPSLEGSTGIFEAGFSLQPIASNKALSLDVNGQAYAGQRQGSGGGIKLKYQF